MADGKMTPAVSRLRLPAKLGLVAAQMPPDTVVALAIEAQRLSGVALVRGRGGWARGPAGEWPLPAAPEAPAAPPPAAEAGAAAAPAPDADPSAPLAEALRAASAALNARAAVLVLPTSMLLMRVLRLPKLGREELAGAVALQMDKLSPFPGDELSVGFEVLAETGDECVVFAAAAPGRRLETVERALSAADVRAIRVDAALPSWWRALRERGMAAGAGRQAVLIARDGEWDLLVLDDGVPVLARGLGRPVEDDDLGRELTLSLLQAEMEAGPRDLAGVLVAAPSAPPMAVRRALSAAAAPVQLQLAEMPADAGAADGAARRTAEGATLDLTPVAWRTRTQAALTRRRLVAGLAAALGLWAALAALLFAGPFLTGRLVRWQKSRIESVAPAYRHVRDTRDRVLLIRRYMDRERSLLECLRTITEVQPAGVDLSSLTYSRDEGCRLSGDAPDTGPIYAFKEKLQVTAPFKSCKLGNVIADAARQKQRFEMDVRFEEAAP